MSCLEPKEVVEESRGLERQRDAYSDHIGFSRAGLGIVSHSEPVVVDADCLKLGLHRQHDHHHILDNRGGPFTSRFGGVGSRHFETHGPRPHKVLGSGLINFRESVRVKAKRTGQAE